MAVLKPPTQTACTTRVRCVGNMTGLYNVRDTLVAGRIDSMVGVILLLLTKQKAFELTNTSRNP